MELLIDIIYILLEDFIHFIGLLLGVISLISTLIMVILVLVIYILEVQLSYSYNIIISIN